MRKEDDNSLYRDTVRLALIEMKNQGKVGQDAIDSFNTICTRFDNGPESQDTTDNKYGKVNPPRAMMQFWQKYSSKGLHDMLQGHDGWIIKMAKENDTVRKYRDQLSLAHKTQLRDGNIPGSEFGKDWYDEHGLGMNMIMRDSEDGQHLKSLYSSLNKIKFAGPNR